MIESLFHRTGKTDGKTESGKGNVLCFSLKDMIAFQSQMKTSFHRGHIATQVRHRQTWLQEVTRMEEKWWILIKQQRHRWQRVEQQESSSLLSFPVWIPVYTGMTEPRDWQLFVDIGRQLPLPHIITPDTSARHGVHVFFQHGGGAPWASCSLGAQTGGSSAEEGKGRSCDWVPEEWVETCYKPTEVGCRGFAGKSFGKSWDSEGFNEEPPKTSWKRLKRLHGGSGWGGWRPGVVFCPKTGHVMWKVRPLGGVAWVREYN